MQVQLGIFFWWDSNFARILCGTYVPSKRWFDKVAQIGPEKSAPKWPFECGEGVQKLFGQCPNAWVINLSGASLNLESKLSMLNFYQSISVDIPEVLWDNHKAPFIGILMVFCGFFASHKSSSVSNLGEHMTSAEMNGLYMILNNNIFFINTHCLVY